MKVLGMLATGLLLLAAGTRAWGAESEEKPPGETEAQAPSSSPSSGAAGAAEEEAAEIPAPSAAATAAGEPAAPILDDEPPTAAGAAAAAEAAALDESSPVAVARTYAVSKPVGPGEGRKIAKEIQGVFAKDSSLKNNRITVTVDHCNTDAYGTNCYVTLAGMVDSQAERRKAEEAARVKGVVIVDNLLDLGEDAEEGVADGALTAKVREQLLADATFKNAIISISTTNGVVRLVGTVPSESVRQKAGEKARQSRAVKRVENALRVERAWQPGWRKTAVSQAPGVAAR